MFFHIEAEYYADLEERNGTAIYGDARRCPVHPGVKTSSDDGMFDGVCHICEGEMSMAAAMWEYDPSNPRREYCGSGTYLVLPSHHYSVACVPSEEDNIPF